MKDLREGSFRILETNVINNNEKEKINVIDRELRTMEKAKKEIVKIEVVSLTENQIALARSIKEKLRKTAETIIEIGNELEKATKEMKKGTIILFYKEIGISTRSAQRYKQIAKHKSVRQLTPKDLEGKTMTDLLVLISPEKDDAKKTNIKKVAGGLYSRYKDKPEELKLIIEELQNLMIKKETN